MSLKHLGLDNSTVYWKNVAAKPGTSVYASTRDSRFDEVHVVVVDDSGSVTGTSGQILEKWVGLSKANPRMPYNSILPSTTKTILQIILNISLLDMLLSVLQQDLQLETLHSVLLLLHGDKIHRVSHLLVSVDLFTISKVVRITVDLILLQLSQQLWVTLMSGSDHLIC